MRAALLSLAAAALLGLAAAGAGASLEKDGDLIVAFEGDQSPRLLPRAQPAPIRVRVAGEVRSAADRSETLPQLRTIAVAINRQGRLFDRGLPSCELRSIQPATRRAALRLCGPARVGSGRVRVQIRLPDQPAGTVAARLLVFNGPKRGGRRLIYAQAYTRDPPGSFVLTFRVSKRSRGVFGTVLSTQLPRSAWGWAYLTQFEMSLHRTYTHRGVRRSYVSAACSVPAAFDSAIFPFARATYGFADGRRLSTTITSRCRVRG